MKPTQQMYQVMKEHNPAARNLIAGLEVALRDVPEVRPFTFPGYPDSEVYLHGCGTVVDVLPGPNDTRECVEAGECDCENTSPWMRIYVEAQA